MWTLEGFLREEDYDCIVYVLVSCLHRAPNLGTFLPVGTLRCVRSTHSLRLLLVFGQLSSESVRETVMFYSVSGRVDLLQIMCERFDLSGELLAVTIHELRESVRGDYTLPSFYMSAPETHLEYRYEQDAMLWEFLYSEHLRTYEGRYFRDGRVIRKKRRECLEYLVLYRDALDLAHLRDV